MRDVLVIGAGGTGLDVLDFLDDANREAPVWRCLGFLDDDDRKRGTVVGGAPVLGPLRDAHRWPDALLVDALGSPNSYLRRPALVAALGLPDARFLTLVHSRASVSPRSILGPGCLVYPFTMIGPGVRLGAHVTVLSHSAINHHSELGDYTIVTSGCSLSGAVRLGSTVYVGTGASIRGGIQVGDGALVGMGSTVVRDVEPGTVVVGTPARPRRRR